MDAEHRLESNDPRNLNEEGYSVLLQLYLVCGWVAESALVRNYRIHCSVVRAKHNLCLVYTSCA